MSLFRLKEAKAKEKSNSCPQLPAGAQGEDKRHLLQAGTWDTLTLIQSRDGLSSADSISHSEILKLPWRHRLGQPAASGPALILRLDEKTSVKFYPTYMVL